MLLCDGCNEGYHIGCIALDSIPEEEQWYCANCQSEQTEVDENSNDLGELDYYDEFGWNLNQFPLTQRSAINHGLVQSNNEQSSDDENIQPKKKNRHIYRIESDNSSDDECILIE